jgi:sialidase-1
MTGIEVENTGLVFRGSESHPQLVNAAFPSVAETTDGEVVVALNIGRTRNHPGVRCFTCRSTNGGRSWTAPEKIFEPDESRHAVSTGIRMSGTPDGELVGFVNLLDRSDPGAPTTNRETGGTVEREHAIIRSFDGGRSWSNLESFRPPIDWRCLGEPSPVLALSDRRWLLPSLTRLNWQGECPLGLKSFVMISEDRGKTWPKATDVFNFWSEGKITWEQKQTRLTDGRLLAVTWVFDSGTKQNLPNHYTFSEDDGDSYGPPLQSPLQGQTCTPFALADNHILCVYRRLDRNGLWAHLARIEGDNWTPVAEKCLWGETTQAMAGAGDSSIQHQHKLQFGYPQMVRLSDGAVFVVFWCIEDGVSVIRWFRVSVDFQERSNC